MVAVKSGAATVVTNKSATVVARFENEVWAHREVKDADTKQIPSSVTPDIFVG
jgi:hypothetical protein